MSLDIYVYVENIDDSLIPLWVEKLNQRDMKCEIHPEFSFATASGYLPFKIELRDSKRKELLNNEFTSGFELDIDDFNLEDEIQDSKPKQNLVNKILSRKSSPVYYVNSEIDEKLKKCSKILYFRWGSSYDIFELRMALLSSATLAVLTNGVCYDPQDDIWYDNSTIIEDALKEVRKYENLLEPDELKWEKFEEWL
ncbi:hypothetical protein [Methanolobus sp.]|uniref:hypothetical protein n=1 Tax=Methanolobus sp. TaxID=1874737 RepID=UPI0025FDF2FF|nr:hypothetical protein [Methanolobus sp.]